jgi:hypothetical protein
VALYSIADAVLVNSIREGINLTAMEFIACQVMSVERSLTSFVQPPSHHGQIALYYETSSLGFVCLFVFKAFFRNRNIRRNFDLPQPGVAVNLRATWHLTDTTTPPT